MSEVPAPRVAPAPAPAPRLASLDAIEAAVWRELAAAAADPAHAWRTPVLATVRIGPDGAPAGDARTVVLREVDPDARQVVVYTDARAAKVGQLRRHGGATLLFWSRASGWQVRLEVACEAIDDGLAVSSRWASLQHSAAAQDYLAPLPPGTALPAVPTPALARRARFAIVVARVEGIDWLELDRTGHRRAKFGGGPARWVQA